jgi:hypothetical protein
MTRDLSISKQLNLPFEYEEYGVNYEGVVYIGQQSVADRLNDVLGFQNWELEPLEININMDTYSVSVLGKLKVYDETTDRWVTRSQYGNDTMNILREETEPRPQAIEDAKKSAISDALKKCASWFGCASDIFKGKVKAIKPLKSDKTDNKLYLALVSKFSLNPFDYKNGIVILPDSYKAYYEEHGWVGIFESDLNSLFGGSSEQPQGQQGSDATGNSNGNSNANAGGKSNGGKGSKSNGGNTNSNSPQPFRIKVISAAKINQDGTAIFDAMLETKNNCVVMVPVELAEKAANECVPERILHVKGWLKEQTGTLKIAKNGKIEVEKPGQRAS